MTMVSDRAWVENLPEPQCRRLLAQAEVGRLGVLVDSAPEVYPVNYVFDGEGVIFRTAPGSKLRGVLRSPSVCFEVDGIDAERRSGWSVMVKGRALELTNPHQLRHAARQHLDTWALGDKDHWVRITPEEITGRRIHRGG